jgi:hypothetical protein
MSGWAPNFCAVAWRRHKTPAGQPCAERTFDTIKKLIHTDELGLSKKVSFGVIRGPQPPNFNSVGKAASRSERFEGNRRRRLLAADRHVRPKPTHLRVFRPLQKTAAWFLQQEKPWHTRQKT